VKKTRLFELVEAYLEGSLDEAGRAELSAAMAELPMRAAFAEQVMLARRMRAALRPRGDGDTWSKIAPRLAPEDQERRRRLADRVEAVIDQRTRRRLTLRWGLAGLAAAAIALLLVMRTGHQRVREIPSPIEEPELAGAPPADARRAPLAAQPREGRAAVATSPPRPPLPASPMPLPASPESRAAMLAEVEASEGPALAQRTDLVQYLGFDRPFAAVLQGRLRPRFAGLGPGLTGNGLRISFDRDRVGLAGGGARLFMSTAAQSSANAPEPARDELHLRYYLRLSVDFDFAGGGVLPGLCVGLCAPARRSSGAEGGIIRPHWTPFGELVFQPLPDTLPRARRWQRFLERGAWQAVEVRVKLNTPGAADGVVEGWLDGDKVVSLTGLRLREDGTTHLEGVVFQAAFKGQKRGAPARDAEITFDDVAVAAGYIGPRRVKQ
jgi:hypothetical protein